MEKKTEKAGDRFSPLSLKCEANSIDPPRQE